MDHGVERKVHCKKNDSKDRSLESGCEQKGAYLVDVGWRRGVVVTELVVSTKLLYVEPG